MKTRKNSLVVKAFYENSQLLPRHLRRTVRPTAPELRFGHRARRRDRNQNRPRSRATVGAAVMELVNGIGWSRAEWETTATLVILPSHPDIAVTVAAEIEGRRGHLPDILRRKKRRDAL